MAKMSTRRKLAIATWGSPREGNIYGKMTLDATPAIGHLEVIDGYEAGLLAQTARDCFENPERFGA